MDKSRNKRFVWIGILAAVAVIAIAVSGAAPGVSEDKNVESSVDEIAITSDVPSSINYQGRLTTSAGEPLSGTYNMTFRLYKVASGGNILDTDMHSVEVTDGLFNTAIGFNHDFFDGKDLWLGIAIGSVTEMTPRQELIAVPYALSLRPGANIIGSALVALRAESSHIGGKGLFGSVTSESGLTYGVVGSSKSPDGYGGYFYNNGGGTGVYGHGGKYGGDFTVKKAGTFGNRNAGVNVTTIYDYSEGVRTSTTGSHSAGVFASTTGDEHSYGVYASTTGENSHGVYVESAKSDAIYADTGRPDHEYGVRTPDKILAMGYDTGSSDVAEYFPVAEDPEPGTVMVIGVDSKLQSSGKAYDTTVAGIVSTAPGVALGTNESGNEGEKLIAVAGRVPCKVDASYASVKPGDLLTTSDTPGHAMKATDPQIGTILGKALEPLDSGTGVIEVLVTLQ
ncbi:MAG: hypothetical protein ACNYVW_00700 [Methanosarcinales archaeon]